MATLTEKLTALEGLKDARDSGVLIARHGDISISYKSNTELRSAINDLEREIAKLEGISSRRIKYSYQPGKGY